MNFTVHSQFYIICFVESDVGRNRFYGGSFETTSHFRTRIVPRRRPLRDADLRKELVPTRSCTLREHEIRDSQFRMIPNQLGRLPAGADIRNRPRVQASGTFRSEHAGLLCPD